MIRSWVMRMQRGRKLGVFVVYSLVACARAPVVQPAPASSAEPTPAPDLWEWRWLPPGDVGAAVTGSSEKFTWINGGQRVSGDGGALSVADHFPISSIVDAADMGAGWLFLTATGALYRSDSFTGPLTAIDTPTAPCRSIAGGPGVAYCVDGKFDLWQARAAVVLEFKKIGADARMVRQHRDELLVVDQRGFVRRLGPGGEPRGAFDTRGRCISWISSQGDDVWMRIDEGTLISANGRDLSAEDSPAAIDRMLRVHTELNDRARGAAAARFSDLPIARPTQQWDRSGRCLTAMAGTPLRLCVGGPSAGPKRIDDDDDDDREEEEAPGPPVLRVELREGDVWRGLGEMVALGYTPEAAIDVRGGLAAAGRCGVAPPARPDRSVCWWVDGAWTSVTLAGLVEDEPADAPPSRLRIYALQGHLLHGRLDGTQTVWDLRRGGERLPLPEADFIAGPWLRDGTILTVVRARDRLLLATTTRAGTTQQALPAAATTAAFATAERGLAVGATVADLWITRDGGRKWTRPQGLPSGDLSQWKIRRPVCSPQVCTAWPFTWFAPELRPAGGAATYVAERRNLSPLPKAADVACKDLGPTSVPRVSKIPRDPEVTIDLAAAPALGPVDAKAVLVVFGISDEEWRTLTLLRKRFGRNLRVVYQPRLGLDGTDITEYDRILAAAGRQGKFWPLFERLRSKVEETPEAAARALGLDPVRLAQDLRDPGLEQELRRQGATLPTLNVMAFDEPIYFVNGEWVEPEGLSLEIADAIEAAEVRLADGASRAPFGGLLRGRWRPSIRP